MRVGVGTFKFRVVGACDSILLLEQPFPHIEQSVVIQIYVNTVKWVNDTHKYCNSSKLENLQPLKFKIQY